MRVVLLRPPRYVWPFNSETSAFWQPLGLLSLAAYARRELPEVRMEVWDCPGQRIGWRTLQQRLADAPIDVLGIGEETVSAHEAIRAARLARHFWPGCVVVAGGVYFAHTILQTLSTGCIDVVVRGEGEVTLAELLRGIHRPARWADIPGLAFRGAAGEIVATPPRPLIGNLDDLPFPAYDLVDMGRYGAGSRNHPALVSIEHSRGCTDSCAFCILWKHMGKAAWGNGQCRPAWRTKSPARGLEEVRRLYRDFGRRTFGWVDPTFNVSARWSDAWAEAMLRSELVEPNGRAKTLHTAWLRADGVVRDERLGVLEKLVRAGLRQVMIGVERDDPEGLAYLNKHGNDIETCRQAFAIFREKYPRVYTIGTMIFGLPGDTLESLRRLIEVEYDLGMDYCFLMPLTPNPGTEIARWAGERGLSVNGDLARYNFHTPVMPTDRLGLRQLESIYWRIMFNASRRRLLRGVRELVFQRDPRKRRVFRALVGKGTAIAARSLVDGIFHRKRTQPTLYSRKPPWYDS